MKMKLKSKTVLLLIVVTVILTLGSVYICYTRYTDTMLEAYKAEAKSIAATEALLLEEYDIEGITAKTVEIFHEACEEYGGIPDVGAMTDEEAKEYYSRYSSITESQEYQGMLSALQKMTNRNDVLSLYFVAADVDHNVCVYVVDGANPENTVVCACGEICPLEGNGADEIINKTYNFPVIDTNYPEYGWLCSAVYALISENDEFVGLSQVDLSLEQIARERISFLIRLVGLMILFSVVCTFFAGVITNKKIVHPLKELADATTSFVSDRDNDIAGKLDSINIETGDEIEDLYHSFVDMENQLNGYINDLMKVTADKERLGAELDLATRIQESALPTIFPPFPDRKEFDIYASMGPAKEVGGDFYDFFLIDEDHLGLVIADVSGKGVPAALFMMISKTIIKTYTQAGGINNPAEILSLVNEQLSANNDADMFVTVWLAIITISTGELISANAGHEYPAIRRANGEFELIHDKHGMPLASMGGLRYRNYVDTLNKGDMIFVYTDGVTEATDTENELFGEERLIKALNSTVSDNCSEVLNTVRNAIDDFVKEAPQFDDITMLSFRYDG